MSISPTAGYLIIDICVACAASSRGGKVQSDFMELAKEVCFSLITTDFIIEEWSRHQSRWTLQWATEMRTLGKYNRTNPSSLNSLRIRLEKFAKFDWQKQAIEKDFSYVETAISTGGILISQDGKAERFYKQAAKSGSFPELETIAWINPLKNTRIVRDWILNRGVNPGRFLLST